MNNPKTTPIVTIFSKTNRYRAEVSQPKPNHYVVRYFGPDNRDLGPKDHEGNWSAVKLAIERLLDQLEDQDAQHGTGSFLIEE